MAHKIGIFVAYEHGEKAFKEGKKFSDNPVDPVEYKDFHRWWNIGYNDMKVITVGRFVNRMRKSHGKYLNHQKENKDLH